MANHTASSFSHHRARAEDLPISAPRFGFKHGPKGRKEIGPVRDVEATRPSTSRGSSGSRLRSNQSPPPSPSPSDDLYNDGVSSIINSTTTFRIPYRFKGGLRSNRSLPPSPVPSGDLYSDEISCPDSPASSSDMCRGFTFQDFDISSNKPRTVPQPKGRLSRTSSTRLSSQGVEHASNGQISIPYQRAPLRDLSSKRLRTRDALQKDGQIRSVSISSSQKENFSPPKPPKSHYEHGPPCGREHIPRNRSAGLPDVLTGRIRTRASSYSGTDTSQLVSVRKRSTRFSPSKPTSTKQFFPSVDVSLEIDMDRQSTSGTMLYNHGVDSASVDASESATVVYHSGDRSHRSTSRNTRFSPSPARHSSLSNSQAVETNPTPTPLQESPPTETGGSSTVVHIPSTANNYTYEDLASLFELVSDLQTRLQCLEKEKETLNGDFQRLGDENLVLFDKMQALEAANSAATQSIRELTDKNLDLNTRLQALEMATSTIDEQAQTYARSNSALQTREPSLEQACSLADDDYKFLTEENPVLQGRTDVLEEAKAEKEVVEEAATPTEPEETPSDYTLLSHEAGVEDAATTTKLEETQSEYTMLSLLETGELEDLRRRLEETRIGRRTGKPCPLSGVRGRVSMPPLTEILASIGVGVEDAGLDSPCAEEDVFPLPPVKKWIRRGPYGRKPELKEELVF
ncbi:hypothetical protein FQN49_002882 [Arthroderma sp. PD_2]|nr:hypothetical protein FQN49_002882 [Arthroderma sp. PD_2]